jgi:shikimate kinase
MKKSNIVLTGFMGVGKTEVGRRLAELLEMKFIDTDTAVESAVGMKIPDIFQKYGNLLQNFHLQGWRNKS